MHVLDQYNGDPAHTVLFAALENRPALQASMKMASFDGDAASKLPSRAFAWETERRFPVHTRDDAVASLFYRSKCAAEVPPEVDAKLAQAMDAYQISPELFVSTKLAAAVETIDVPYAVPSQQRLPLGSEEQIKVAEMVLLRDKEALDLETRTEAFLRLEKAASIWGVPVDPTVSMYAGSHACDTRQLQHWVGARAAATKVAAAQEAFEQLEDALGAAPAVIYDRGTLSKLAARLYDLDKIAEITHHYDRALRDPMASVFNGGAYGLKVSADMVDLGGVAAPVEQLLSLPADVWEQVDAPEVGEAAASGDVNTFKQILATLPLDIKQLLARQMGL